MSDLCVGLFWDVYGTLYTVKEAFDNDNVVNDGKYIRLGKTHEEMWEKVREENNLPNKPCDNYRYGEVMFDLKQHKFSAFGTSRMHDKTSQTQIINAFKLSSFVLFNKYDEEN